MKHKKIITHIILGIASFLIAFPLLFALLKSTQSPGQVMSARLMPGDMFFRNVSRVWNNYSFYRYMANSMKISLVIMVGKTIFSFFAAFALVFMDFKGKKFIFGFIIVTLMMPTEMLIIGLFDVVSLQPAASAGEFFSWFIHPGKLLFEPVQYGFGWTDKAASIVVPFLASATAVFMFRQHFRNIPGSLMDASLIDGAGPWRFILHVLFPLSRNTIGALFVVQFVYAWNQYLWPRVIIRNESAQVIQVGLKALFGNSEGVEWGQVMAGSVITMIPPLIILILLHDQFMKGIAFSDNK